MMNHKRLLHRLFSWCPLYRMAIGGYWYYSYVQEHTYRAEQFCSYGRDVHICMGVTIECPQKMKIGDGVFIGSDSEISATGGLQLGNYCALAPNTTILTVDHQYRGAECIPYSDARMIKPVVVGDCVWIGRNASILPGVTIGEGAIVGLGSVVPKDVPPFAIVVGNPARIVKYRDEREYYSLKEAGAFRPACRCNTRFWIPTAMKQKYGELLQEIGYDVNRAEECFEVEGA